LQGLPTDLTFKSISFENGYHNEKSQMFCRKICIILHDIYNLQENITEILRLFLDEADSKPDQRSTLYEKTMS